MFSPASNLIIVQSSSLTSSLAKDYLGLYGEYPFKIANSDVSDLLIPCNERILEDCKVSLDVEGLEVPKSLEIRVSGNGVDLPMIINGIMLELQELQTNYKWFYRCRCKSPRNRRRRTR